MKYTKDFFRSAIGEKILDVPEGVVLCYNLHVQVSMVTFVHNVLYASLHIYML